MRPLTLTIRGINSFDETQTVDFEPLMSQGFFGIFGPTGSGKTTILDGITLALYGEMARKSANFINSRGESGSVSFTFSMEYGGKGRRVYRADREFKTDRRTGGVRAGKCRLADISGEEPEILADSVREMNRRCRELLGLSCEDFSRTVVLPQGKFSEFLNLKGNERNQMLERLFHLGQYGEELTGKLKSRTAAVREAYVRLAGEAEAYGDVTREAVREAKRNWKEQRGKLTLERAALEGAARRAAECREVYNLLEEQKKAVLEQERLAGQRERFAGQEEKILRAERALPVLAVRDEYLKSGTEREDTRRKLDALDIRWKELDEERTRLEERRRAAEQEKEERLLPLTRRQTGLAEILTWEKERQAAEKEVLSEKKKETAAVRRILRLEEQTAVARESLQDLEQRLEELLDRQKRQEKLRMAWLLRGELTEGEVCPVCGARVHIRDGWGEACAAEAETLDASAVETAGKELEEAKKLLYRLETKRESEEERRQELGGSIHEKQEKRERLERHLEELCGEMQLEELSGGRISEDILDSLRKETERELARIRKNQTKAVKAHEKNLAQWRECDTAREAARVRLSEQTRRVEAGERHLDEILRMQGFASREEAEQALLTPEQIREQRDELDAYRRDCAGNERLLREAAGKLAGRSVTEEEVREAEKAAAELSARVQESQEREIRLKKTAEDLAEDWEALSELKRKMAEKEHVLDQLTELTKLFSGKRFVQYAAAEKLRYVSLEASRILYEISGSVYGLETGEGGGFFIRDYRNGGILREASTLSGGESFLASLSLALALSGQLQLTSEAPLELFFLDEGFGTLDDDLLEVVMDALERVPGGRRAIGLISHVAEIRSRIPVRLAVTPAQMGGPGSRIALERG